MEGQRQKKKHLIAKNNLKRYLYLSIYTKIPFSTLSIFMFIKYLFSKIEILQKEKKMWLKLLSLVAILSNAVQSDSSADLVPAETLHYEYGRSYGHSHHHQPYGGPYGGPVHGYRHK